MGTATAQTQIVRRAARPAAGCQSTFNYGDSTCPAWCLPAGSQQTASIGASVIAAHRALVKELLRLAGNDSPLAGLDTGHASSRRCFSSWNSSWLCRPRDSRSLGSVTARASETAPTPSIRSTNRKWQNETQMI